MAKTIEFFGRASHGSLPFEGINALNAATMGLMGIHANREIFRDEDQVRIHPIITNGGSIVNSVPDYVRIETYVRAANAKAMDEACMVVDRAMKGAAMTVVDLLADGAVAGRKVLEEFEPIFTKETYLGFLNEKMR